jgi:hypothetical protein
MGGDDDDDDNNDDDDDNNNNNRNTLQCMYICEQQRKTWSQQIKWLEH